jgi:pimeloyl-ACP methyl ester carboxylesterase
VPPPYILVGHSFGGPLIRVFADLYPGEIAGLVLVDPTQEEFIAWQGKRAAQRGEKNYDDWKDGREWEDIQSSLAQAQASRVPEGVPVVLITGMGPRVLPSFLTEKEKLEYKTNHQMWLKFHTEWVERQLHARHLITENSGHGVPFEEPELVINAIRRMVEQVKEHRGAAAQ